MKKTLIIFTVLVTMLVFTGMAGLPDHLIKINWDSQILSLESKPIMINDRVYVPIRSLGDSLNKSVDWDGETNTVYITSDNKKIGAFDGEKNVEKEIIPDEETAIAIGKLYLERYTSGSVEYENSDKVVYLKAYRQDTLWHIYQTFYYKDGRGWAGSIDSCSIKINAENGEVVYIDITSNLPK